MTTLEYYEGLAAAKRAVTNCGCIETNESQGTTPDELKRKYIHYVEAGRKKKGAGKGYKVNYRREWTNYAQYLRELRELSPRHYGLELCQNLYNDMNTDRYWDVDSYRGEALKSYRSRITSIRKEYGLTSTEVQQFMRVG